MPDPLIALALNSGSSSLKFGLYRIDGAHTEPLLAETICTDDPPQALARIGRLMADAQLPAPAVIGHRIVHGGPNLLQHCLIDDAVVQQLEAACAFAPLHTPTALSFIRSAQERFPRLPQIACFDTCFHAAMPDVARVLPIPKNLQAEGIRRYGFHGLSCESILHQLGSELPHKLIIAHLGNGASITAIKDGKSIDTSMGLTPSGGVIMGTRSGDLDPGVLLYLLREKNLDATMLEQLVDHRCGLLGISDVDSDMQHLRELAATNADARLAIQMFCYSVRKQLAAMIAVLNGVDLIVFTGGIGENDAETRETICSGLSWLGVSLDPYRNRAASNSGNGDAGNTAIHDAASRCSIRVIASHEDAQIARHAEAMCVSGLTEACR